METIEIKPIRTEAQYKQLMAKIETLLDCAENSQEEELLEVLSILADDYENKVYPIPTPDPIEAIKYKMEEMGLVNKDISKYFGGVNRMVAVLDRKKPMTLKMAKALYQNLHISAESLLTH